MNTEWKVPDVPHYAHMKTPTIWFPVLVFPVALVAGIIVTVLTWKQGQSIIAPVFFVRALVVPALIAGALTAIHYTAQEDWNQRVDYWNYLCKNRFARWQLWTQEHLSIISVVTLSPEIDLAERMLKLEGTPPSHPNETLKLINEAEPETPPLSDDEATVIAASSRVDSIGRQLMAQYAKWLQRFGKEHSFSVVLVSDRDDLGVLRSALVDLKACPLERIGVSRIAPNAYGETLETWIDKESGSFRSGDAMSDFCIVLGYQLHEEGALPVHTEAAAALLFASSAMVERYKLKPQARLFRPIVAALDELPDALHSLTRAEQTTPERVQHFWFSALPKLARHKTVAAVNESALTLQTHDLDAAIGKPGPVSPMFLQTLAVQMVHYAQGGQLLALPDPEGVRLTLLDVKPAPVAHVPAVSIPVLSASTSLGSLCPLALMFWLLIEAKAESGWWWALGAFAIVIFVLQLGGSFFRTRKVQDDFYNRLWRLREG